MISLGLFGDIELDGVLRSEVEGHIREALSTYLRNPVVTAQGLMRVSVQGAVGQPGFYVVPADMLLSETLMVAGGPGQNAKLDDLRIERGIETLMEGTDLQEALRAGLSLDQLNMQAGDQVVLPAETPGGIWSRIGIIVGLATSLTLLIVNISR
jgi:protein involved in polysaccharide export with SLBB domain